MLLNTSPQVGAKISRMPNLQTKLQTGTKSLRQQFGLVRLKKGIGFSSKPGRLWLKKQLEFGSKNDSTENGLTQTVAQLAQTRLHAAQSAQANLHEVEIAAKKASCLRGSAAEEEGW